MNIPFDSPELDTVLTALANQKRREIIHFLSLQPATIGQLAESIELSLPAIHKHIRALEGSQLIVRKKAGRTNFVALNTDTLGLAKHWISQYHVEWSAPDATLQNYIARLKE